MTVRSILDSKGHNVVSIEAGARLSLAVKTLAERRIGAMVVVNTTGSMEGIISERDVVRVLAEKGPAALEDTVRAAMTSKVVTCTRSETVGTIMERMTSGKFRHVPVIEEGRLVGIVSIGDVVKHRLMEFERESEALRDYIKTA